MQQPPNKIPKMDLEAASSIHDVYSSSEDFKRIRYTPTYVDKSLLVKEIFKVASDQEEEPIILITAPRRFGKTVNLSMLHYFLEKQVDKATGNEIACGDVESNTKLFAGLDIMKEDLVVNKHFGKYAVLKANFLCTNPVTDEKKALAFCKQVIHDAYNEHPYLCTSNKLNGSQQSYCKEWCDDREYITFPDDLVTDGLKNLSKYLHLHYTDKIEKQEMLGVFVLIDEYDSMFYKAMSSVEDTKVMKTVVELSICMVSALVKNNSYVKAAFLTGISHISGMGLSSSLGRLSSFRFLKANNKFTKYYGFTSGEVQRLCETRKIGKELEGGIKEWYNGYQSEDGTLSMYNTWSVVNAIKEKTTQKFWVNSGAIESLCSAFCIDEIKSQLVHTIMYGDSSIQCIEKLENDDFYELHKFIHHPEDAQPTCELFFTFLLEQGYLSYGDNGGLKIPNEEIKKELRSKCSQHLKQVYRILSDAQTACKECLSAIFSCKSSDCDLMRQLMRDFARALEKLFLPLKERKTKVNHGVLQQVLFVPLFEMNNYHYVAERPTEEKKKPDIAMCGDEECNIIELKLMANEGESRNNSESALWQILEKQYWSMFFDEEYFKPQPAKSGCLLGLSFIMRDEAVKVSSMHYLQITGANRDYLVSIHEKRKGDKEASVERRAERSNERQRVKNNSAAIEELIKKLIGRAVICNTDVE